MNWADELSARAQAATGLTDYGEASYREGLERLLDAVEREANLNAVGRIGIEAQVVGALSQRLQVEDWYARHPEIDDQQIVAPLIGLGLPRTGSTAFHSLVCEDPNVRPIRNWEALNPCPPPETAHIHDDPRIAIAEAGMERRNQLFPRMKQMLPSTATSAAECQTFMALDFKTQIFQAFVHIPSYTHWFNHEADLVPTYRYLKRILKLLQWRCPPNRWRLKNPTHILFIDALHQVFPDARYWMTHRDVAKVLPSVADLYFELHKAYSDDVDKQALGAVNTDWCRLGMERMIAFRAAGHEDRFFDAQFAEFQADPYPVLERLYAFLGDDLTDDTRARMEAWRIAQPREKHGAHKVDPAEFGLEPAALHEAFRFYTDRFNVASSPAPAVASA